MPSTVRAFFAIKVPCPPTLGDILRALGTMGSAVRPTADDLLHLTLRFLGETPTELIEVLSRELSEVARVVPPFSGTLAGLGAFPSLLRPRVVWAGLRPERPLATLVAELDRRLVPLGFVPESRPFHPHVTLARVRFRSPVAVRALCLEHQDASFGEFPIASVALQRSDPTRAGSRYTDLAVARLGTSDSTSVSLA